MISYLGLDLKASGVRSTGCPVCVESARGAENESLLSCSPLASILTLMSDKPSIAGASLWDTELTDGAGGCGAEDSGLNLISNSCSALE